MICSSGDLLKPIHYYALESICAITLDARMGCLKDKPNDDRVLEVMRAIETVVASFFEVKLMAVELEFADLTRIYRVGWVPIQLFQNLPLTLI